MKYIIALNFENIKFFMRTEVQQFKGLTFEHFHGKQNFYKIIIEYIYSK